MYRFQFQHPFFSCWMICTTVQSVLLRIMVNAKLASCYRNLESLGFSDVFFGCLTASANGKLVVWIFGIPSWRDCYFGVPLESQTTNPNHPFTIGWLQIKPNFCCKDTKDWSILTVCYDPLERSHAGRSCRTHNDCTHANVAWPLLASRIIVRLDMDWLLWKICYWGWKVCATWLMCTKNVSSWQFFHVFVAMRDKSYRSYKRNCHAELENNISF